MRLKKEIRKCKEMFRVCKTGFFEKEEEKLHLIII